MVCGLDGIWDVASNVFWLAKVIEMDGVLSGRGNGSRSFDGL